MNRLIDFFHCHPFGLRPWERPFDTSGQAHRRDHGYAAIAAGTPLPHPALHAPQCMLGAVGRTLVRQRPATYPVGLKPDLRVALIVGFALLHGSAWGQSAAASIPARVWHESKALPRPALLAPLSAPAQRLSLGVPGDSERQVKHAAVDTQPAGIPRPIQIGFNRALTSAQRSIDALQLPWQTLADGSRVAHVSVQSHSAVALRVQLSIAGSGGGELRFYSPSDGREI